MRGPRAITRCAAIGPGEAGRRLAAPALLLCLVIAPLADGHALPGVSQETIIRRERTALVIDYRTHLGAKAASLVRADRDRDGKVSAEEHNAVCEEMDRVLRPKLRVTIDGKPKSLDYRRAYFSYHEGGKTFSLLYRIGLTGESPGVHEFSMWDSNVGMRSDGPPSYYVHGGLDVRDMRVTEEGKTLTFRFSIELADEEIPILAKTEPAGEPASKAASEAPSLVGLVERKDLSPGVVLFALGAALLLGMTHALSPGHGKAMVAAYLVGARGRVRDAVWLGLIVTSTHVSVVLLLGLALLFLPRYIAPQSLTPWIGAISGALVFLVGYWMLASRALGASHRHDHHSDDDPGHGHTHAPKGGVTLGALLSLGVAGGMVPCPLALVVLLVSVAVQRVAFGVLVIVVFSLGMAVVLVLIGVLTVTASRLTQGFSEQRKWIQRLPVFSAGVIMVVGVSIAFNSLLSAGIISLNL